MENKFTFKLINKCKHTNAKVFQYTLSNNVMLPIFMPVATYGAMRSIPVDELDDCHSGIILSNTYHCRNMKKNVKNFMGFKKSLLTDSGGFQIQSLPCTITDEGIEFKLESKLIRKEENKVKNEHTNKEENKNKKIFEQKVFTPEDSMDAQFTLGADIIMQLDDVVNPIENKQRHAEGVKRSIEWLDRAVLKLREISGISSDANKKIKKENLESNFIFNEQILFPIIQGGLNLDLREKSIYEIIKRSLKNHKFIDLVQDKEEFYKQENQIIKKEEIFLNGVAIGGMCGGENKNEFAKVVHFCTTKLSEFGYEGPIYVMGVGYPDDIVVCSALGTSMSDCVYPTRMGRTGKYFWDGEDIEITRINKVRNLLEKEIKVKSLLEKEIKDENLLFTKVKTLTKCDCAMCEYSFYYLHIHRDTPNLCNLASKHNLLYMKRLGERIRESIINNRFEQFIKEYFIKKYKRPEEIPKWILSTFEEYFKIFFR
ncbi:Tgt [Ecytonucleospora hepatopenaei]|uniref:Tgt n=1 Tax=Ecytonucleospora hepatopenaei TaxID=646526 RepID=A0A1W0E4N6_9MICR|nr:Tgt [Ecytonucleospora hepatopenaei]